MARWIGIIVATLGAVVLVSLLSTRQGVAPAPGAGAPAGAPPAPGDAGPDAGADLSGLLSDDPGVRAQTIAGWSEAVEAEGIGPVPRLFAEPGLAEALAARAGEVPDDAVRALGEALAERDEWVERLPALHARYLSLYLSNPTGERTIMVLEEFNRFDEDDARAYLGEPIAILARHENWKVRYHSVDYAGHYLGASAEPVLVILTDDERGDIRRRAWIMLAALRSTGGLDPDWREMPAKVAEGALLAIVMADPEAGVAALDEVDADPEWARALVAVRGELRRLARGETTPAAIEAEYPIVDPVYALASEAVRAEKLVTGEHPDLLMY
jgi:hypothetical protein